MLRLILAKRGRNHRDLFLKIDAVPAHVCQIDNYKSVS